MFPESRSDFCAVVPSTHVRVRQKSRKAAGRAEQKNVIPRNIRARPEPCTYESCGKQHSVALFHVLKIVERELTVVAVERLPRSRRRAFLDLPPLVPFTTFFEVPVLVNATL